MHRAHSKIFILVSILFVVTVLGSALPAAAADLSSTNFRFFITSGSGSDEDQNSFPDGNLSRFRGEAGSGGGLSLEWMRGRRWGLEASLLSLSYDLEAVVNRSANGGDIQFEDGSLTQLVATFGINFHLTPDQRFDVYLGPFAGLSQSSNSQSFGFTDPVGQRYFLNLDSDNSSFFGALLGVDIPLGQGSWALHTEARVLQGPELTESGTFSLGSQLDISNTVLAVGLTKRFSR